MGMNDDRLYECFRKVYDVFIDPPNLTEEQEDNHTDIEKRLGHLVYVTFSSEMVTRYFIEQGWLPDITGRSINKDDIVCDYWMSDGLAENDYCSRGDKYENK